MLFESHSPPYLRRAARAAPLALPSGPECLDFSLPHDVTAESTGPGDVVLVARIAPRCGEQSVIVHWEVATDARFRQRERYGLLFAEPAACHVLRIAVEGLAPGRSYWARLCAYGAWSRTVHLETGSHATRRARSLPRLVARPGGA